MDSAEKEGARMRSSRQSAVGSWQSFLERGLHIPVSSNCRLKAAMLLLVLFLIAAPLPAEEGDLWAILLAGVSGDPGLQKEYLKEVTDLHAILTGTMELPKDRVLVFFDDPSLNPELIQHKATLENLRIAIRKLAGQIKEKDTVFVFLEGHGSYDGKTYKLNLVGPDPAAEDLAALFDSIPSGRLILVNATSSSGGGIPSLSGKNRILITATKSGMERNRTHLGRHFIDAFRNSAADSDKNGRVSILEAFTYARLKVEAYYAGEDNLPTEHPVLEDNGDAQAQSQPSPENGDGVLAATTYLDSGKPRGDHDSDSPEKQALTRSAQEIEKQIEILKYAKGKMSEADYEKELEALLLKLARIHEKLAE
jgi:hypothetical protein